MEFLPHELPYADIRCYLATFLNDFDHFILHKTFHPMSISTRANGDSMDEVNKCACEGKLELVKWLYFTEHSSIGHSTYNCSLPNVRLWMERTFPKILKGSTFFLCHCEPLLSSSKKAKYVHNGKDGQVE